MCYFLILSKLQEAIEQTELLTTTSTHLYRDVTALWSEYDLLQIGIFVGGGCEGGGEGGKAWLHTSDSVYVYSPNVRCVTSVSWSTCNTRNKVLNVPEF